MQFFTELSENGNTVMFILHFIFQQDKNPNNNNLHK